MFDFKVFLKYVYIYAVLELNCLTLYLPRTVPAVIGSDSNAVMLLAQDGRTPAAGDQLFRRGSQQEVRGPCEGPDWSGSWEESGSPR
jgi:hypothetical protein